MSRKQETFDKQNREKISSPGFGVCYGSAWYRIKSRVR